MRAPSLVNRDIFFNERSLDSSEYEPVLGSLSFLIYIYRIQFKISIYYVYKKKNMGEENIYIRVNSHYIKRTNCLVKIMYLYIYIYRPNHIFFAINNNNIFNYYNSIKFSFYMYSFFILSTEYMFGEFFCFSF